MAASRAAKRERLRTERLSYVESLSRVANPIERLVRALWLFSHYAGRYKPALPKSLRLPTDTPAAQIQCDEEALRALFGDLWPAGRPLSLGFNPPWDSAEVARWFIGQRGTAPATRSIRMERGGLFGRVTLEDGWQFANGSTYWIDRTEWADFLGIGLTSRGKFVYGQVLQPRTAGEGFNAHALRQMAQLCGFAVSPEPPRPIPPPSGTRPYDEFALLRGMEQTRINSHESPLRGLGGWSAAA